MFAEELGDLLKGLRKALNKDQQEVAEQAGISQAALSLIENQKRKPSPETLSKIVKALGANMNIVYLQSIKEPGNLPPYQSIVFNLAKTLMFQILQTSHEIIEEDRK